ncbi:long-chain-fatty-acid--CoA ligase [Rhodopirellula sp. MGV]|uniref:long-chain-fatty-acid--CoA ligase n=1 Tax=Rhodopirellula sp. MGV TaxID=2023130 RepID=UPI000B96E0A6|nr:long-chain-fatty-acid--CoA ligase [Rhodopirellula sp. MGV]OYP36083.1 hypothetical protein CGZ80_10080 [Rhodopirellula sp. MGV]
MAKFEFTALDACETLGEACQTLAERFGDHIAFALDDDSVSFAKLDQVTDRIAAALVAEGCGIGARVALIGMDSLAGYLLLFGCAKAGCVLVPINWKLSAAELSRILDDCDAKLLFADNASSDKLSGVRSSQQSQRGVLSIERFQQWLDRHDQCDAIEDTVAQGHFSETPVVQIYTSGTTGTPKGVVLSHRAFIRLRRQMRSQGDDWMGFSSSDRLLLSLPQFHIGGLWWAVQGFLSGSTGYLMPSFVGWKAIELIVQRRVTQVPMVPAMIQFVLAEPTFTAADFSSVRGLLYGGSPIAAELLAKAQAAFNNARFFQIYGLTETGNMAVCLRPEDHSDPALASAAGQPLPGVECKVVGPDGGELDTGEVGEIWLRSPSAMLEYYRRPDETNATLVDGWVKTGDAGYLDGRGFLFVCDRIKDMIIYAGENIFPAEIETALRKHAAIADVAVIGVPDPKWGESPKAFLVLRGDAEKPRVRDLLSFVRSELAEFKVPKSFEFVTQLPRNPSGKVLKTELRKPYWENHTRKVN